MPRVGFETTIPAFERTTPVNASDRAATVKGTDNLHIRGKNVPSTAQVATHALD
jgi:hypothetical protein